jgi:heat shock protein HslJ
MRTSTLIGLVWLAGILPTNTLADNTTNTPITQQKLTAITKVQWQLDVVRDTSSQKPFPKEPPVTIVLEANGKVAGGAPVNRYFGEFELADDGTIQWKGPGFGATMMAGLPELMDLEQYYFKILHQCDRLSLSNDRLIFHTQDGKLQLEFKKQ